MGHILSHTYLSGFILLCLLTLFYFTRLFVFRYLCYFIIYVLYYLFMLHDWSRPHSYYLTRVLTLHTIVAHFNTCSGLFWQPRTCMFRFGAWMWIWHQKDHRTSRKSHPAGDHRLPAQLVMASNQPILFIFIRSAGNYIQFGMIIYSCTSGVIFL